MRLVLFLALPLYVLDQITKFLVLANIPTHVTIEVIPGFFNLVQVHNTGAAFGMMKDNNWFFIGLATVAIVAVAVMARRGCFLDAPSRIGAALLGDPRSIYEEGDKVTWYYEEKGQGVLFVRFKAGGLFGADTVDLWLAPDRRPVPKANAGARLGAPPQTLGTGPWEVRAAARVSRTNL